MIRKIIKIDEDMCNGCGLCADACHEGAIGIVDGKAKLLRDDYCDGLGDCLPVCPTGAISFEQREAAEYDEAAVKARQAGEVLGCGCPGSNARAIHREQQPAQPADARQEVPSRLSQWPVQIRLAPVNAHYFKNADLLIAADCSAFAYGDFHSRFMRDRVTLIGCPKLDEVDYSEKLTAIFTQNEINSVTVVRMEVPCCKGIADAVKTALQNSGKMIPWRVVTLSADGRIVSE